MKILHLKYKMHKLVNLVFYLIIFGIGFLLGFGAEKINFNKLISQFLFIDNVNAYTFDTLYEGTIVNEDYLYNLYSTKENFNINKFRYIYCYFDISSNTHRLDCYAFSSNNVFDKMLKTDYSGFINLRYIEEFEHFHIFLEIPQGAGGFYISKENIFYNDMILNSSSFLVRTSGSSTYKSFSNFDISKYTTTYRELDFSKYITSSGGDNENTGGDNTGGDNTGGDNTGGDNTGGDNTGGDNTGGDNTDEDIDIEVVNSGFYEFAQKIFGEVSEENKFIYDFITFGLVATCFTLFVLVVGYIFNKFFGG